VTSRDAKLKSGKFDVDVPLVERLVARQFPHWAGLPIRPVATDGWDNWTFHLGDRMKVRFPSAEGYAEQAAKEARWLPRLAPHLPVAVPVPLAVGEPDAEFPWLWSVYQWIEGETVTRANAGDRVQLARDVAAFLRALQGIDTADGPRGGPHSHFRGASPFLAYEDEARRGIDMLADRIDARAAHALLDDAKASQRSAPPVWVHGDIAVGNLLLRDGRLAAVIDFGCSAIGDPACDLVMTWLFFDGESRRVFREAIGADDGTWLRARGWALWKAALVLGGGGTGNGTEAHPFEVVEAVLADHRERA
jgi:aminoglycoside phosphotransferase (APT) family kinase protein